MAFYKLAAEKGQVLAEYAMMLALFAGVAVMLLLLLASFTDYGLRLVMLVAFHDTFTTY
jgi:hypothetical protein